METIAKFVKFKRKEVGLNPKEFALKAGDALTVIRKIEKGNVNLNLEKVRHVIKMFGHELAPVGI